MKDTRTIMGKFFELLLRGLLLRCPVCGQGKLFKRPFKMNERCPHCGLLFEREEGYYTGSMAINLVISEFLIAAFTIPLAANPAVPLNLLMIWGAPSTIILPLLFFHHSRGLWLSMDHYLHPVERQA